MKGVVFTEFLDFVAATHGSDMADEIIEDAALPHDGAYTSVGTYPFQEMQRLVAALCHRTRASADALLKAFGGHLCSAFAIKYPDFFTASKTLFDFLESVDQHIHVEVYKLYPDAELPTFRTNSRDAGHLSIDYASCRPLESLAEGMIRAAARHFGETVTISRRRVEDEAEPFTRFLIEQAA
ncbi:heme NO-binding domain-containing protein [Lichenifustis flavocetrariae]|uniref:Heme NO-binding domain-containing protein n=1 Tax=Lichenifustis flavocetrariae TaxID=2949735 RepID=A0AA42CIJ1_9HYPH|nr:heme NO-binding domain-containing protein [Lichenifustis flavocetrariae]MCW6508434.1 heme NO-binding domain-containing protein [Lichenifustis flavocetrariae]